MFDGLTKLVEVRLGTNRISHIDQDIFKDCVNLERIYLGGNPIYTVSYNTLPALCYGHPNCKIYA